MAITAVEKRIFSGIDIGGTGAFSLLIEGSGNEFRIIGKSEAESSSRALEGPRVVVEEVIPTLLKQSLSQVGVSTSSVKSMGIDLPTAVNSRLGITLDPANMRHEEWRNFHFKAALRAQLAKILDFNPSVLEIENDAAATMRGLVSELRPSARAGLVVGLFVGTGLGGAALLNGKNVFNNISGGSEPGATHVPYNEETTLLSNVKSHSPVRGSSTVIRKLEDFVSIVGIARQLRVMHENNIIPANHPILELQGRGEKDQWRIRAENIIKYAVAAYDQRRFNDFSLKPFLIQQEVLGLFAQSLIQFMRPKVIFIGGGVVDPERVSPTFADWYLRGVRRNARLHVEQDARKKYGFPQFKIPMQGDSTPAIGAALLADDAFVR